jgi:TPR repeat protein
MHRLPLFLLALLLLLPPVRAAAADRQAGHGAPDPAGPSASEARDETAELTEALRWYTWQAEQGNADAQFYLGLMHALGKGMPRDYEKAAEWYRKAAEQCNADARFELGRLYAVGDGVPQDLVQAYIWTSLAADQGHSKAMEIRELIALQLSPAQMEEALKSLRKLLPKRQE